MNADEKVIQEALGTLPIKRINLPEVDIIDFVLQLGANIVVEEIAERPSAEDTVQYLYKTYLQPAIFPTSIQLNDGIKWSKPTGAYAIAKTERDAIIKLCGILSARECYYPIVDFTNPRSTPKIDVPKLKYTPTVIKHEKKS